MEYKRRCERWCVREGVRWSVSVSIVHGSVDSVALFSVALLY